MTLAGKRIWIAGHRGMVGSALVRALKWPDSPLETPMHILTVDRDILDLRRQTQVEGWVAAFRPEIIVIAAATVGGILANQKRPVDFLYDNLLIQANIIRAAAKIGVEKLLVLGSSCVYPPADEPITPDALLSGPLEPTNEWYAVAKIAGIKLCQAYRRQFNEPFISAMPCNLYGPGDTFDLETSHVVPALMVKFHTATTLGLPAVTVWGDGRPLRELMHVDDCARALLYALEHYDGLEPLNIGSGEEIRIAELAGAIAAIAGYPGEIRYDWTQPNGARRKLLDSSVLRALGWTPQIPLRTGLEETYRDFLTTLSP